MSVVQDSVGLLIKSLERHASVMAGTDPDPVDAVSAEEAVRAAARAYAMAVMEHNGWGHPFNDLFATDDGDGPEETEPEETEPEAADVVRLSVEGRWDFYVDDPAAWSAFVEARMAELGLPDCAPDLTDPAYALSQLVAHDDLGRRLVGHGLRDGGSEVFTGRIEQTLAEEGE